MGSSGILGNCTVIVSFSIEIGSGFCGFASISRGDSDCYNDDSCDVNTTEEENAELEEKAEFADDDSSS